MSRMTTAFVLAITLMAAGCGYGSHNYMTGTGTPHISQLAPPNATAGGGAFVLTVDGTGLGADSVVYWGMTTRSTTYVSPTQVTANITATDIMTAGSVEVYVHSGGTNSNTMTFTIQ